jgi:hypothetical protein
MIMLFFWVGSSTFESHAIGNFSPTDGKHEARQLDTEVSGETEYSRIQNKGFPTTFSRLISKIIFN